MALGNSAGVLFKISADNSDAKRAFNETERDVKGLSGAMGAMGGPAGIASTAILAVGAAAAAAVVGIARLTIATADFGSQLFDAQAKTGLTASQLSALKLAADTSGSSFESITNSVAKFNVLLGQGQVEGSKADKILEKYGITAKDSGGAIEQAFNAVYEATNKNVAAMDLFKDRTGQTISVIDTANGSLKKYEETCRKFGLTLTEQDIRAADEFGDVLEILGKQAQAAGQQFALGLMPAVTDAMTSISAAMGSNTDVARSWGEGMGQTIRGTIMYFNALANGATTAFNALARGFGATQAQAQTWSQKIVSEIGSVIANFGLLFYMMNKLGESVGSGTGVWLGPMEEKKVAGPKIPRISGGGGVGGGGGKQDTEFADAEKRQQQLLDLYKDGYEQQIEENNNRLVKLEISETEHLARLNEIKLAQLETEKRLLEETLTFAKITADKKIEIEHELDRLRGRLATQRIKNNTAEFTLQKKSLDDYSLEIEKFVQAGLKLEEARAERIRKLDEELYAYRDAAAARSAAVYIEAQLRILNNDKASYADRLAAYKAIEADMLAENKRRRADENARHKARKAAINEEITDETEKNKALEVEAARHAAEMARIRGETTQLPGGEPAKKSLGLVGSLSSELQEMGIGALKEFGAGLGSIVEQWVLMGKVGPDAMKKLTASVLAGLAAQAVVKALFYTAEGIAALFWNPPAAAGYFKAAALMAVVAGAAGGAGRAIAGGSFNQASGTATGSGQGSGQGSQQNNFTTRFNGFDSRQNETINQNRMVMGALVDELSMFRQKVTGMSPGEVVAIAADENPGAFRTGYEGSLSDDYKTTGGFMRQAGLAR